MSEYARGRESAWDDLTRWAKARAEATGERASLDLAAEFHEFMAGREVEEAEELKRYSERFRLRVIRGEAKG